MSEATETQAEAATTTHAFEADVARVLRLVIDSLYSQREVYLRELIANAVDALDKRRFAAVQKPEAFEAADAPRLRIRLDDESKTLEFDDNGIGMSADELAENLGRIAHSGTRALAAELEGAGEDAPSELIGRFGVGFYSAFLVAKRVEVISRRAEDREAKLWASDGVSGYSLTDTRRVEAGTTVRLQLKDDAVPSLHELRTQVKRYADALPYPIWLGGSGDEASQVNQADALWRKSPRSLSEEDYAAFASALSGAAQPPLTTLHAHIEGTRAYYALLQVPASVPPLFADAPKSKVALYAQRVPVMPNCEALVPPWLRFLEGVVDSEDLPLNVSRETLQDNATLTAMREQLTKRFIAHLEQLAEKSPELFEKLWRLHGPVIKEGVPVAGAHRGALEKVLRFPALEGEAWLGLTAYKAAMKEGQEAIYYALGDSLERLRQRPELERFRAAGIPVLLAADPVDAWVFSALDRFDETPLKSAFEESATLPGEEAADAPEADALVQSLRQKLQEQVAEVRYSAHLRSAPACLKRDASMPPHVLRALEAMGQAPPQPKPALELNATHPLVSRLREQGAPEDAQAEDWGCLLLGLAELAEGQLPADVQAFTRATASLLG